MELNKIEQFKNESIIFVIGCIFDAVSEATVKVPYLWNIPDFCDSNTTSTLERVLGGMTWVSGRDCRSSRQSMSIWMNILISRWLTITKGFVLTVRMATSPKSMVDGPITICKAVCQA